eukprot:s7059_g3.t1
MENYWASALQDSMHPTMAELAQWLEQAFGQELVVQHEGILGIAKASGLLPIGKFILGASAMFGMESLAKLHGDVTTGVTIWAFQLEDQPGVNHGGPEDGVEQLAHHLGYVTIKCGDKCGSLHRGAPWNWGWSGAVAGSIGHGATVVHSLEIYHGIKHCGAGAIFTIKVGLLDEAAHGSSMTFLEQGFPGFFLMVAAMEPWFS